MQHKRILFVEDEVPLLQLVSEELASAGYKVDIARDGAGAVGLLAGGGVHYHAVISDISMPGGVSGFGVAEGVRAHQPDARMILVSGLARAQLPALPAHAVFLPKPYRISELVQLLQDRATEH